MYAFCLVTMDISALYCVVILLQKREAWEAEKTEADMERFFWEISKSKETIVKLLQTTKEIDKVRSASSIRLQHNIVLQCLHFSLKCVQITYFSFLFGKVFFFFFNWCYFVVEYPERAFLWSEER